MTSKIGPQAMCPLSSMPPVLPQCGKTPLGVPGGSVVNLLVVSNLSILKALCGVQR